MFVVDAGSAGAGRRVVYGASDLAAAARCEYALLRVFDTVLGRGPAPVVGDDALQMRTAALGEDHERRLLERLRTRVGDALVVIGRPAYTEAGIAAAARQTAQAVAARAPVIYQAAVLHGRFLGFADFLVLDEEDRYRLVDTKLARSAKVEALLALAAYAEGLRAVGAPVADEADLVLGDDTTVSYRLDEIVPVFRQRRDALHHLLDSHLAADAPVDWDSTAARACLRCEECEQQLRRRQDLLLVAGMRASARARLVAAGVTTVTQLADHRGPVPHLPARTVASLSAQARLQVAPRVDGKPPYEVADPRALMVLPDPDRGDLFFDFEGDPLWSADGRHWGLEYLWGVLGAAGDYTALWAHDRAAERRALVDFLALVRARRRRHPRMHIYHYAPYERATLLRLAGHYGVGEDDVDDLLRSGVLVDLYPLLRTAVRVGTANYSLKSLEPLYMGADLRTGDVTTAAASITGYAAYCALRDSPPSAGRDDDAAALLGDIERYNRYDCRSTRRLRDWLLARAIESAVPPRGPQPVPDREPVDPPDETQHRLLAFAGDGIAARTPAQQAVAMVAAARGYHRREDKPFWWAHFDRVNNPVDEWAEDSGVFCTERAEVVADWHQPPRARTPRRHVRLHGSIAAGELSSPMYALYDPPSPAGLAEDTERRAFATVEVIECDDPDVPSSVVVCERRPRDGAEFAATPAALTPGPPINTAPLRASLEATAATVAAGLPDLPADAVTDLLLRRPPRLRGGGPLPRGGAVADDITAALLDLDDSYLAVHGPPGTGKTLTAAAVIARLVCGHQWRVGVVAQAHATVENLLRGVMAAGVDPARIGKKRHTDGAGWTELTNPQFASFIDDHDGCLVGGTSWDFANDTKIVRGSLDLLVVEEAGQYSLANTIAVAPAARNLLLLGDPQQLPQVTLGSHPEPVADSALGWLIADAGSCHTLPAERGYFLDRSYRMHPAVCAAVSRLSYDGRLRAHDALSGARRLDGIPPGVHLRPVEHAGNAVASPEEAAAIAAEITALLGRTWTDEHGSRPLQQRDVLVVSPYNAQVAVVRAQLDAAGLRAVRAGTVDKFQGQQAPVTFLSMTASSVDDVPRGIAFLLDRHRLNVAVSRAQYAALIVASTVLTDHLPATGDRLVELGAFLRLCGG